MSKLLTTAIAVFLLAFAGKTQESKYDFVLITTETGFRLESCIPENLYNPRLVIPGGSRREVKSDVNNPPMYVIGSSWVNECLIVDYTDSELPDEDWIDLITTFTILTKEQVNLIHKK